MLDELTPEQAFELLAYVAHEPIGEVRMDLRFAHSMVQAHYLAGGKKAPKVSLGEFVLYKDIAEDTRRARTDAALIMQLNQMARRGARANGD